MKRFRANIKEKGNTHILHPEYVGDATRDYLEAFWGLKEPDVEWYEIVELED